MKHFAAACSVLLMANIAAAQMVDETGPPAMPLTVEGLEDMDEAAAEAIIGSINPLDNDLRGLEVAIRMHEGFLIREAGALFELGVTDSEGVTRLDEDFTLVATTGVDSDLLREAARQDFYIRTFKLDAADYARMQAADLILQDMKRTSTGNNQLKFNAGAKTCAHPDIATPDEYRFAVFVRTAPDVDFVPLSSGDIVMSKGTAGPLSFAWEPCQAADPDKGQDQGQD